MNSPAVGAAFRDPAMDSQQTFRILMDAMAHPGTVRQAEFTFHPPAPLEPAATAIVLTLADFETSLWVDRDIAASDAAMQYLRFHSGARFVEEPSSSGFALVSVPGDAPSLSAFGQGKPDFPDRSTTVIFQVADLRETGWRLSGPGIKDRAAFSASPLPPDFVSQLHANRATYPLGVDLIFAEPDRIAALPRSTHVEEAN